MLRSIRTVLAISLLAAGATSAFATIVQVQPDVVLFTPASVVLGATESDTDIIAFDEEQCITVPAGGLDTDQGNIAAGREVSCHFLHMDPVTDAILQGRARFDTQIIGVISSSTLLDDSDALCEDGVAYPTAGTELNRGLESTQVDDYNIIDAGHGIAVRMEVPPLSFSDQVRVITCCAGSENCD